jgi:hypothetical protein
MNAGGGVRAIRPYESKCGVKDVGKGKNEGGSTKAVLQYVTLESAVVGRVLFSRRSAQC